MHRIEGANTTTGSLFTDGPPATTVPDDWFNAVQEEIANAIEQSGGQLLTAATDTRNQLWAAIQSGISSYDLVITSQQTFENAIERVAANQYQFKSIYTSIFMKSITGGYSMSGVLSDGDSWGYLETNNAIHLEFQSGTFIGFGSTIGYIKANTADGYLKNVQVNGDIGTVAAVTQSFLLANVRVTFENCKATDRNSNVDMAGFQGSGTELHNVTSKYINCTVYTLDGSDKIYGFYSCYNLSNCVVYDLDGTIDTVYGFNLCTNLSSCLAYDIDTSGNSQHVYGFSGCNNVSACEANNIETAGTNSDAYGFNGCQQISGCRARSIKANGTGGDAIGFNAGNTISACSTFTISSADAVAYGFRNAEMVSACYANDVQTLGGAGDTYGFEDCDQISSCVAANIISSGGTAEGFANCEYGAAVYTTEVTNSGNDWIDTVDVQITNKVSTPSVWT